MDNFFTLLNLKSVLSIKVFVSLDVYNKTFFKKIKNQLNEKKIFYFFFLYIIFFYFLIYLSHYVYFLKIFFYNNIILYFFYSPIYLLYLFFNILYLIIWQLKLNFFFFFNDYFEVLIFLESLQIFRKEFFSLEYFLEIFNWFSFKFPNTLSNLSLDIYINFFNFPFFILFLLFFFFCSFISIFFISYLGFLGIFYINFIALNLFWISLIFYFKKILFLNKFYYINFGKWIFLNQNYKINFDFFVDNISFSFAFLTTTIAVFVYIYAFSYFRFEPLVDRFIILLNLFVISMVFLVFSGNLINLFLGWEMIGITSFFLINFWVTRAGTFKAGFKAYSFNKLSDFFIFFAILLLYNVNYSLDINVIIFKSLFNETLKINFFFFSLYYVDFISLLFLGSICIKSAQIGFHIWLPDSMEAPVPASSLIHSATLVSAGIFLLIRFTTLFEKSYFLILLIALIGSVTAFYGGLVSMFQSDTKRILAYSTISHCGFLMVIYTTFVYEYLLLYLYIHGFFKAATFMCVGNVNRFSKNNQDFKNMGMFYKYIPFDCCLCFIGLMNLSGLPFSLGFFIKHLLFLGLNINIYIYNFIFLNCLFGALTGLFYSSRLFYSVFFDIKKSKKNLYYSNSNKNLFSKFFSNTTFASNFAIMGIFLTSYFFGIYFFYYYLSNDKMISSFFSNNEFLIFLLNFSSYFSFLFNFTLINLIILIMIVVIIFSVWKKNIYRNLYIDIFFFFYLFSIVFLIL